MKRTSDGIARILLTIMMLSAISISCNLLMNVLNNQDNLTLDPRAEDGSVSGSYSSGNSDDKVNFNVTRDGFATFRPEGGSEAETLTVDLSDDQTVSMGWYQTTLDGFGPLTDDQKSALDDLMNSSITHGLEMIPLDIACRGEEVIDPKQLAALLVPLQMRYKYMITDRGAESQRLIALSECGYGSDGGEGHSPLIIISRAAPVPVVFGYFPFNAEGAVEPAGTSGEGSKTACLSASPLTTVAGLDSFDLLESNPYRISAIRTNETGPCDAMCRGACGRDCEPWNCNSSKEIRCEVDDQGNNTGMLEQILIYDCGMHQGCIDHDNCYDKCNETYGCGSWNAADCRHGFSMVAIEQDGITWYCDTEAKSKYGKFMASRWAMGLGDQPLRETFEYSDESFEKQMDLKKCPVSAETDSSSSSDSSDKIPAGTYRGETTFLETLADDIDQGFLPPVCSENFIQVVISSDGTAQGEVRSICYSEVDTDNADMRKVHHSEVTGLIRGTLVDSSSQLFISFTWRSYFTSPQWDTTSLDDTVTFDFPYHVSVSGNVMTLSVAADIESYYSFTLYKE